MPRILTLLFILCASLPAARVLSQPSTEVDYSTSIQLGLADFDAGRWASAREHFRRAHALDPGARTLRAIGNASFELSDYPETVRSLTLALAETRRPLTPEQRTAAEALIARAEPFVARIALAATPADANVTVNGAPACMLERTILVVAGTYTLAIEAEGYASREESVTVTARSTTSLAIELARNEREGDDDATAAPAVETARTSTWQRPVGWALVGVAGGSAVVSLITGIVGQDTYDDLARRCTDHVCGPESRGDINSGRALVRTSTATTVITVATGAAGAVLLILQRGGSEEAQDTPQLDAMVGPGSFGLGVRGSF